jgi:hypothetical protein
MISEIAEDRSPCRPVFVVGSYRSGTSAATWAIGQHSNIWNIPEAYWFTRFCADLDYYYSLGTNYSRAHLNVCGVTEDDFLRFWRNALHGFIRMGQERWLRKQYYFLKHDPDNAIGKGLALINSPNAPKTRWVDGTPENSHYIDVLHKVFPEAKFVHLVRDPEEVVHSLLRFDEVGGGEYTMETAFRAWNRLAFHAYQAEQALGSDVVRRFMQADMLNNPAQFMKDIFDFVGEEFEAASLRPLKIRLNTSHVKEDTSDNRDKIRKFTGKIARESRELYEVLKESTRHHDPDPATAEVIALERSRYLQARSGI